MFSVKKVWGMKLHFMKGKGSRSDLTGDCFRMGEQMGTESDKVLWKLDPKGRVLCMNTSFFQMLNCL